LTSIPHLHHKSYRKKKETSELNITIDQMDSIDIYRIFHQTTTEHMFFSAAHRTLSKIYNILGT
jgi:hypothetical protein